LERLGPELALLTEVPLDDIRRAASPLLAEAVSRLRRQRVIRQAGYDGAYGTVRLFKDRELRAHALRNGKAPEADAAPRRAGSVSRSDGRRLSHPRRKACFSPEPAASS